TAARWRWRVAWDSPLADSMRACCSADKNRTGPALVLAGTGPAPMSGAGPAKSGLVPAVCCRYFRAVSCGASFAAAPPQPSTDFGLEKNTAPTAPTRIAQAGSTIDWLIAVENPACRASGRAPFMDASFAGAPAGAAGNSAASRAWIRAAMAADPRTAPIWRVVLNTPEPAPAWRGSRLRVVALDTGPQMKPLATPCRALGSRNIQMGVSGRRSEAVQKSAPARQTRPKDANQRGLARSIS